MSATKSMMYYALAILIMRGTSLIMLPITTSFVAIEEYGVLNLLSSFTAIAGIFLTFGLGETIFRYASSQGAADQKKVHQWCFTVSLIGSFSFTFVCYLFAGQLATLFPLPVTENQFIFVIMNLGCSALTLVPYVVWRTSMQVHKFTLMVFLHTAIQSLLTIWLLFLGWGIEANLIAGALSSAICGSWLLWSFRTYINASALTKKCIPWQYPLSIMLSVSTVYFLQGAEQWIIASYLGAKIMANYFIAAQLGQVVALAIEPFKMWWFARRHRSVNEPEIDNPLYSVLGPELACMSALVVMLVMPFLLSALLPASYLQAVNWLHWICIVCVLRQQSEFMNLGCYVKWGGKSPLLINLLAAVIMITGALFLVKPYGLTGILLAMLTANVVRVLLFLIVSQILLYQEYDLGRIMLMWIWLSLAFVAAENEASGFIALIAVCHLTSCCLKYRHKLRKPITIFWGGFHAQFKRGTPHA